MKYLMNLARAWMVGAAALMLAACGGGEDTANTGGQTQTTGSVALLLTDAPNAQFQEINLTVTQVELLGDGQHVTLYNNPTGQKVNLLALQLHSELFALNQSVPAGKYEKIRLQVSDVELVKKDAAGNVLETIKPKLPGHGKIDLNPRGEFTVVPGETLVLQIDVDAKKSIHIVQTGNGGYIFRPVIFVDIINGAFSGKLLRISGNINRIDFANHDLRLCNLDVAWIKNVPLGDDDGSKRCIDVSLEQTGVVFNSLGDAVAFETLALKQSITVVGFFHGKHENEDDDKEEHDAQHQGHSLSDNESEEHYRHIHALVIEAEGFARLKGTINSVVASDNSFDLKLASGQGYADGTVLHVTPVAATKLLNKNGVPQSQSLLTKDAEVMVEGVVDLNAEPDQLLKPAIIFVDPVVADIQLSGAISGLDPVTMKFTIHDAGGDRCVKAANAAVFKLTSGNQLLTEQVTTAALANGQDLDAYGQYYGDDCLIANHVLIKVGFDD
ncbi:MAG: DUF4382 domain-containing protein [Gammaproteobacteria bacterium]|nr:DUF4382 domain-containing protein [Gammaproteobacteria bacterium]